MKKIYTFILAMIIIGIFSISANAQLTGTKTIGVDYTTIALAIADLNAVGVGAGGVTFNVPAGYTETIAAPLSITATGTAANQIIFQKSGAGANPLITRTDAGTNTTSSIGGLGDAIIRLDGTDFITFDGIDLAASLSSIEYGYFTFKPTATNGCQDVTIKNSTVTMTKGTSAFVIGIYISNGPLLVSSATGVTVTATSGINQNIVITGNTVQNVHAGIYMRGSSAVGFSDNNYTIGQSGAGNIIQNFGGSSATTTYGLYFIYVNNPTAAYNTINNAGGGGTAHGASLYGIFYSVVSGNVVGSNNTITTALSATSATQWIYNANTCTSETYNNNTFAAGTFASTSSSYLIYSSNSTTNKTISGNTTSGTISKTSASGAFYCYYNNGSPTGTENVSGNNFSNITLSGTSSFYGINSTTAAGHTQNFYNNTISNITLATGTFYGTNLTTANTRNVYGNTIQTISGGATVYGMNLGSGSTTGNIYKNRIYNLSSSAAGGFVYGIYVSSGTLVNVYNNFVSDLRGTSATGANAINGIYIAGGTTVNLYYNTVYLKATGGATFGSSGIYKSSTTTSEFRNNIIVNESTPGATSGNTVALRWSGVYSATYYTSTSNNNCLYAGTPGTNRLIYFDGTNSDQTIAAYKSRVASRDAASFTELPPFANILTTPYDLHLQTTVPTQCESGGTVISTPIAITDDFDGNIRNVTTPDIGADEGNFTGLDLAGPTILYTVLGPTNSLTSRSFINVSITDVSGVNTASGTKPRVYYKRTTDGNTLNDNTSGTDGWKYAEANGTTSPFDFIIDYSLLNGGTGVAAGQSVQYFVVAQDLVTTPNISINSGTFTATQTSVALTAAAFPIGGTINQYQIVDAPLFGDYTISATMFNKITGKNITFEKVVKKIIRDEPVFEEHVKGRDISNNSLNSGKVIGYKKVEVEEISWIPMENGKVYTGDLYVKKSEHPELFNMSPLSGAYATLSAAVNDLNLRGVSAATRFLLTSASYTTGETYPITINEFAGASATNTLTIKPDIGVTASISSATATALIKLNGADYVIIDGSNNGTTTKDLTLSNTNTALSTAIWIGSASVSNGATYNTVKNCNINGSSPTTTTAGILIGSGTTLGNAAEFANTNLTIQNNNITAVQNSIYHSGYATTFDQNITITGNTLGSGVVASKLGFRGLILQNVQNFTVSGNTINGVVTSTTSTATGIQIGGVVNGGIISNNLINDIKNTNAGGYGCNGIFLGATSTASNLSIYNNIIYDVAAYGWSATGFADNGYGMFISTGGGYNLYYNSINMATNQTLATGIPACLNIASTVTTANSLDIRNNILVNTQTVGTNRYTVYSGAANTVYSNINYNDYYFTGPNLGYMTSANVLDLAAWKTATGKDVNSVSGDPNFISATNLHIQTTVVSPVSNAGTPIAAVTTDYDGDSRSGSTPDIGADEYVYSPPVNPTFSVAPTSKDFGDILVGLSSANQTFTITNTGGADLVITSLTKTGTNPGDFVLTDLNSYPLTIIPLGTATIQVNFTPVSSGAKSASLSFVDNATGSPHTIAITGTGVPIYTVPYTQDFETGAANWSSAAISGTNNWAIGSPSGKTQITTVHGGSNAYITNLTGITGDNNNEYVLSPIFNFSSLSAPMMSFWHNFYTETGWDACEVQYTTDLGATWTKLDANLGTGTNFNTTLSTNWYNSSSTSGPIPQPKFSGTSTAYTGHSSGWIQSVTDLLVLAGKSTVQFRFRYGSDGSTSNDGWAIDDFQLYQQPPMTYTSSTTTQSVISNVNPGTTNQQIIGIQVVTSGVLTPLSVNRFEFDLSNTTAPVDILNATLYYTGTSSTFAATSPYATDPNINTYNVGDPFILSGAQTLATGINYFWLTYDIDGAATFDDFVDANCNSIRVASSDYAPTISDPGTGRQIAPNVLPPAAFTSTTSSATQINLNFTPNASTNNVLIVWNATGTFTTPSGAPPSIGGSLAGGTLIYNGITSPQSHSGLTQGTQYFYKAFSYDGIYYSPGLTGNATTYYPIPYSQDFNAGLTIPAGWSQTSTLSNVWTFTATTFAGGTGNEATATWTSGTGTSRLVSPPLSTSGMTQLSLSFKHFFDDYGAGITYKVQSSMDGVTWTDEAWTNASGLGNAGPQTVTTTIMNNLGGKTYVAFVLDGNHFQYDNWYVDDISITLPPTVDLGFTQFYQSSGLPIPMARNGEKFTDYRVTYDKSTNKDIKQFTEIPQSGRNLNKSDKSDIDKKTNKSDNSSNYKINDSRKIEDKSYKLGNTGNGENPDKLLLSSINVNSRVTNYGINAASYSMNWSVGGVSQTTYTGPSVSSGTYHDATNVYTPTAIGTFLTTGSITVASDENASNNTATPFRLRSYPNDYSRTLYDLGTNVVTTNVGYNNAAGSTYAAVRYSATSSIQLAGVDCIFSLEGITGTVTVNVCAAGSVPGAVLYTKTYNTADYQPSANDYIFFPFDNNAPIFTSGTDYWITIQTPVGPLYPFAAQSGAITTGRSFVSNNGTAWSALILTSVEYAWIMRSVNKPVSTLNLTAMLQGFYDGTTMVSDTVTVELRNSTTFALVDQSLAVLNTSGVGTALFTNVANATPYYIVIKHRNALETWSATAQSFTAYSLSYDFTSAVTQAYGSNLVLVGTKWCIYIGDVTDGSTLGVHDGYIDAFDLDIVFNDNVLGIGPGQFFTDLNGDQYVDAFDLDLVFGNNTLGTFRQIPPGAFTKTELIKHEERKRQILDNRKKIENKKNEMINKTEGIKKVTPNKHNNNQ